MASLKNVHPCTFYSFEFSWWKTRYCLEPLTSCQYSDVTVICNVPVANYLASFTKIKFLWNVVSDLSARRPWRYWAKTRLQCAQGWAWDRSETSFGTKLVLRTPTDGRAGNQKRRFCAAKTRVQELTRTSILGQYMDVHRLRGTWMYNSWRWFKWSHSLNFSAVFIYSIWCVYPDYVFEMPHS